MLDSKLQYIKNSTNDNLVKEFIEKIHVSCEEIIAQKNVLRLIALSTDDNVIFNYCSSLIDESVEQMKDRLSVTCWGEDIDFESKNIKDQLRKSISDNYSLCSYNL